MLVGAYRDDEVGPDHPLTGRLQMIRQSGAAVDEITLGGIRTPDIALMVADALHDQRQNVFPLASMVFEKAAGNPFFTNQFLAALVDEGLLFYDPGVSAWRWDIDDVGARHFSGSVVDLMVERLSRLTDATQQALKQLACLGNHVKASVFSRIVGSSTQET